MRAPVRAERVARRFDSVVSTLPEPCSSSLPTHPSFDLLPNPRERPTQFFAKSIPCTARIAPTHDNHHIHRWQPVLKTAKRLTNQALREISVHRFGHGSPRHNQPQATTVAIVSSRHCSDPFSPHVYVGSVENAIELWLRQEPLPSLESKPRYGVTPRAACGLWHALHGSPSGPPWSPFVP